MSQGCCTVIDDHITTRALSMADIGRYCRLLVTTKRTTSDFYGKRTNFPFDKAQNTATVYVYIFRSDPRVVFIVAAEPHIERVAIKRSLVFGHVMLWPPLCPAVLYTGSRFGRDRRFS